MVTINSVRTHNECILNECMAPFYTARTSSWRLLCFFALEKSPSRCWQCWHNITHAGLFDVKHFSKSTASPKQRTRPFQGAQSRGKPDVETTREMEIKQFTRARIHSALDTVGKSVTQKKYGLRNREPKTNYEYVRILKDQAYATRAPMRFICKWWK